LNKRIHINGQLAKPGDQADEQKDEILFDGKKLPSGVEKVYYLVNKPIGVVCTTRSFRSEKKITDLVPDSPKVYPVGRLDKDSSGLIILTNDGDLANQMTHPRFEHKKIYQATVQEKITPAFITSMRKGVHLEEGLARADKIKKLSEYQFEITIHQGWNRQIRRMCGELGYRVSSLHRIQVGDIKIGSLKEGEYKVIDPPSPTKQS